jgi:hypothetical protein
VKAFILLISVALTIFNAIGTEPELGERGVEQMCLLHAL